MEALVDALFSGRSALLFTYGVTNAGKSHTMMGRPEDEAARGLMPRALDLILERAEAQGDQEHREVLVEGRHQGQQAASRSVMALRRASLTKS